MITLIDNTPLVSKLSNHVRRVSYPAVRVICAHASHRACCGREKAGIRIPRTSSQRKWILCQSCATQHQRCPRLEVPARVGRPRDRWHKKCTPEARRVRIASRPSCAHHLTAGPFINAVLGHGRVRR